MPRLGERLADADGRKMRRGPKSPFRAIELRHARPGAGDPWLQFRVGVLPEVDEPAVVLDGAGHIPGLLVQLAESSERQSQKVGNPTSKRDPPSASRRIAPGTCGQSPRGPRDRTRCRSGRVSGECGSEVHRLPVDSSEIRHRAVCFSLRHRDRTASPRDVDRFAAASQRVEPRLVLVEHLQGPGGAAEQRVGVATSTLRSARRVPTRPAWRAPPRQVRAIPRARSLRTRPSSDAWNVAT